MTEPVQILLFAVIIAFTILMIFIGWQIFQILGEIRKMLKKTNIMADSAVSFTNNIGHSLQNINGFSDGLKSVLGFFRVLKKKSKEEKKDE